MGVGIKGAMRLATSKNLLHIKIHSSIIGPVVCKRDNKSNAGGLGLSDDDIEFSQSIRSSVDGRCRAVP